MKNAMTPADQGIAAARQDARERQASTQNPRMTKRAIAAKRVIDILEQLEEHISDAAKDGNLEWHDTLARFASALYAAPLPTKDGHLRIELDMAGR